MTASFEEGRYLYCIVATDRDSLGECSTDGGDVAAIDDTSGREGADGDGVTDATALPDVTGVDDEPVRLVEADGMGAVVHDCSALYDTDDPTKLKRWLVRHQAVIDRAGEAFGTPLPCQFDTIVTGDDDAVRALLDRERETLASALDSLAGHWEYRVTVRVTDDSEPDGVAAAETEPGDQREEVDPGTSYLLERRDERERAKRRRRRHDELRRALFDRLDDLAREVHDLGESSTGLLEVADAGDERASETICRLSLLAHADTESAIGAVLDDVAEASGIEVRFSGPWPPYTYAPSVGAGGGEESDGGETDGR